MEPQHPLHQEKLKKKRNFQSKVGLSDYFKSKEDLRAKLLESEESKLSADEVFRENLYAELIRASVALEIIPQDGFLEKGERLVASGVFIHEAGLILTCAHCLVGDSSKKFKWKKVKVKYWDEDEDEDEDELHEDKDHEDEVHDAIVVDINEDLDLAILAVVPEKEFTVAKIIEAGNIKVGLRAYLVSNRYGYGFSLTSGIVSYDKRAYVDLSPIGKRGFGIRDDDMILIECDAPTSKGSSGCGIFNSNRDLMGIFIVSDDVICHGVHVDSIMQYLISIWEKLHPFEVDPCKARKAANTRIRAQRAQKKGIEEGMRKKKGVEIG